MKRLGALSASVQGSRRAPGTAGNEPKGRAAEGVSTPDSLRPLGSRVLVPPRGPKTAGAAAPVAAAACSWRARAAAAAAASSTSTAGCLGLSRRECWAPARPPSHPPRQEPQQLRRPGPIRPDPRSQDRGTRSFLLRRKIRPDLLPPPPSPQFPAAWRPNAQARRRPGQTCVSGVCIAFSFAQWEPESGAGGGTSQRGAGLQC